MEKEIKKIGETPYKFSNIFERTQRDAIMLEFRKWQKSWDEFSIGQSSTQPLGSSEFIDYLFDTFNLKIKKKLKGN